MTSLGKTVFFKSKLNEENKIHNEKINKLNNDVKKTDDIDEKESLYKEIDQEIINMQITDSILSGLLTQAFAVVKETARRFVINKEIEVIATSYDRELSRKNSYVNLKMIRQFGQIWMRENR